MVGLIFYRSVLTDVTALRRNVDTFRTDSQTIHAQSEAAIAEFALQAATLKSDLEKKQAAFLQSNSNMSARVQDYTGELRALRNMIDKLEARRAMRTQAQSLDSIVLSIVPPGQQTAATWRLPIPE